MRQSRRRWLDSEARTPLVELEISVLAAPQHLEDVHQALQRLWQEVERVWSRPPDSPWRAQFATGVGEIAANIMQYAYTAESPGAMSLRLRAYERSVEACFRDNGQPYVPRDDAVKSDPFDVLALAESGRGIALAQAAVDQLTYERSPAGSNRWCLVKSMGK
jgi:serine/threonine-protein kinase RsbW